MKRTGGRLWAYFPKGLRTPPPWSPGWEVAGPGEGEHETQPPLAWRPFGKPAERLVTADPRALRSRPDGDRGVLSLTCLRAVQKFPAQADWI